MMVTIQQATEDTAAIEALAIRFATLQVEHDQRAEDEAKQRSRDAIRAWGERVPAVLKEIDVHARRDSCQPHCNPATAGFLNLFPQEVKSYGSDY